MKIPDITQEADETISTDSQYVIVPSTETNMNNKCLICREQIKATYNDEIGEWCWYNCIRQPGEPKIAEKLSMSLVIMNPARRDQRTMMI